MSARAGLSGEAPYQSATALRERFGFPEAGQHVGRNPHPPLSVVVAAPFAWLPFDQALAWYQAFQVLCVAGAWHWACRAFARGGWVAAAAGGLLGLWSPVWQGLNWGQPVGVVALATAALWHLARGRPVWGLGGVALALACTLRPFFFIVATGGAAWPWRRLLVEAACAALAAAVAFGVVGLSPLTWLREAEQIGKTFGDQSGSLPGVLGLGGLVGMALYAVAGLGVVVARLRGADADETFALGLGAGLLTYPLAWFHYDTALIPVLVWAACTAHRLNASPALWLLVLYLAARAVPNMASHAAEQWLQVVGRSALVVAVLVLIVRTRRAAGANVPVPTGG